MSCAMSIFVWSHAVRDFDYVIAIFVSPETEQTLIDFSVKCKTPNQKSLGHLRW